MTPIRLRFRAQAQADLTRIFDYIRGEAGARVAQGYVERLLAACASLPDYPELGRLREDLAPGIRTLGFEQRVVIVYRINADVEVARVLYGGQDLEGAMNDQDP